MQSAQSNNGHVARPVLRDISNRPPAPAVQIPLKPAQQTSNGGVAFLVYADPVPAEAGGGAGDAAIEPQTKFAPASSMDVCPPHSHLVRGGGGGGGSTAMGASAAAVDTPADDATNEFLNLPQLGSSMPDSEMHDVYQQQHQHLQQQQQQQQQSHPLYLPHMHAILLQQQQQLQYTAASVAVPPAAVVVPAVAAVGTSVAQDARRETQRQHRRQQQRERRFGPDADMAPIDGTGSSMDDPDDQDKIYVDAHDLLPPPPIAAGCVGPSSHAIAASASAVVSAPQAVAVDDDAWTDGFQDTTLPVDNDTVQYDDDSVLAPPHMFGAAVAGVAAAAVAGSTMAPGIVQRIPGFPMPNDPQQVPEYQDEIFDSLRESELKHLPNRNYMQAQTDITPRMRAILIDWLVEVAIDYNLHPETLYLTVNYIDRYLSRVAVNRTRLQLVGVTCMFIAAKYEEITPPSVEDFVYMTENTYDRTQVLQLETSVLTYLNFNLTVVSPYSYLRRFTDAAAVNDFGQHTRSFKMLSAYFCELMLQEFEMIKWPASMVAAAAVCVARHTLGLPVWSTVMEAVMRYRPQDLSLCMEDILFVYRRTPNPRLKAVYEKFSHNRYHRVSLIPPPGELPPLFRHPAL